MRILFLAAAAIVTAMLPSSAIDGERTASAQSDSFQPNADAGFQAFLYGLRPRAIAEGVRPATLDAVLPTLTFNQRVIDLDRSQPGGPPTGPAAAVPNFAPYFAKHVDADRIARGRAKYQALRPLLGRIEAQTGVPESIMIAIWGNETNYGSFTGDFDLLRSLASLAYEGRRRELFTEEFIATLKLLDRGIPRERLKGSWAGATGYPQFLPSMYIRLGMDGDGDGKADIWTSQADALASIANYFVNAGWKPNVPWGVTASVPAGFNRDAVKPLIVSPRCPRVHARHSRWLSVAEWRALGVIPTGAARISDNEQASLIEPDGPGATAYLLTTNYRSILDYNCSNFYALSVGLLANAVSR
ncbi:lytic murein transglycosylase [Flavisphingomonas formosensis]|uniref:lytic murein transglycosylase n=1 Tax=Flavisphingomonas formosensis TaxID=861534 RepID=UPI0012F902F1|nr:lytic murein transglycosylase [Sphingomonas formosensis]